MEGHKGIGRRVHGTWNDMANTKRNRSYNRDRTILRKQILAYLNGRELCKSTVSFFQLLRYALQWKFFENFQQTIDSLYNTKKMRGSEILIKCHQMMDVMFFEMKGLGGRQLHHIQRSVNAKDIRENRHHKREINLQKRGKHTDKYEKKI